MEPLKPSPLFPDDLICFQAAQRTVTQSFGAGHERRSTNPSGAWLDGSLSWLEANSAADADTAFKTSIGVLCLSADKCSAATTPHMQANADTNKGLIPKRIRTSLHRQ